MNMREISIDFEIHRLIELNRSSFADSPNGVLRRLLGLDESAPAVEADSDGSEHESVVLKIDKEVERSGGLFVARHFIANGTRLRKFLKGEEHTAEVRDGAIWYAGKSYNSPSGAACVASQTSVNGWKFWEYYDNRVGQWRPLDDIRKKMTV